MKIQKEQLEVLFLHFVINIISKALRRVIRCKKVNYHLSFNK